MGKVILVKFDENGTTELYRYRLGNLKRISYDINTPVSPMTLPEEDSDENILIKIEGNSSMLKLNWIVQDTGGIDLEESSRPISISTVPQQLTFFRTLFRADSINDSYKLILQFGDVPSETDDMEFFGTISQFSFSMTDPSLLTFTAKCTFLEGNVVSIYESDTASEPPNIRLRSPSTGTLAISWSEPLETGSSEITGYAVFYRQFEFFNKFIRKDVLSTRGSLRATSITSLSNEIYEVYVRPITLLGLGKQSTQKFIEVMG